MVEQNGAGNQEFGLIPEDINAAFQAHPQAAQTAQINLLNRILASRNEEIESLKKENESLKSKDKAKS